MRWISRLWVSVALVALSRAVRADEFEATQAVKAAQNPPGVRCELRFAGGKTQFRQGETIRVTLAFSSETPGKYRLNLFFRGPRSLIPLGTFEVSPRRGVVDPLAELPKENFLAISGYVPEPVALSANPTEITVDLNEYLRFDRPGIYRLGATTTRVLDNTRDKRGLSILGSGAHCVASTLATLEILPFDAAWASAQVEAQRALWKQPRQEWQEPLDAPNFRYLPTREAMQAIIEHLGTGERPRSSDDETAHWQTSLVGFADRPYLIGAMRRAIARPDYAVTQGLLQTLSLLRALEKQKTSPAAALAAQSALESKPAASQRFIHGPLYALQNQLLPEDWERADAALKLKTGRTRAMTLHSLLELAWLDPALETKLGRKRVEPLQALVPAIFTALPPLPQEYLLADTDWKRIKSPAMAAPLIRVWKALPQREGSYAYFADAVLTRILEIAPVQGRDLALREMNALRPRATIEALQKLPDHTLPQFDQIWLHHLQTQNGDSQDDAALLIGRYASPAIRKAVAGIYRERQRGNELSTDVKRGLQIYLKRVATRETTPL